MSGTLRGYGPGMRRALLAALLLAALGGCAGDAPGEASTVGVRAAGCEAIERIGTGVVVDGPTGPVVVTSAHTVTGAADITVIAGDETAAALLAFDPAADLALLTAPEGVETARVASDVNAGDPGRLIVWEPDGRLVETDVEVTRTLRVTIEDIFVEADVERLAIEIDTATVRGDSGAPVFNDAGEVLGVVYARSREREASFAVRHEEIAALLRRPTIDPSASRCR